MKKSLTGCSVTSMLQTTLGIEMASLLTRRGQTIGVTSGDDVQFPPKLHIILWTIVTDLRILIFWTVIMAVTTRMIKWYISFGNIFTGKQSILIMMKCFLFKLISNCILLYGYNSTRALIDWLLSGHYFLVLHGSVSQGQGTTKFVNLIGWNGYWPRSRFSHLDRHLDR